MVSAFGPRVLAMMADSRRLIRRGHALPPAGTHCRPGGDLFRAGGCLGLPLVTELIPTC
jgi:hypothetical protein